MHILAPLLIAAAGTAMAQEYVDDAIVNQSDNKAGQGVHAFQFSESNQTLPAVDGFNAKLAVGTVFDDADASYVEGSFTIPLGHQYGLQIDGVAAEFDSNLFGHIPGYSLGAHAFWRDPSRGLLGVYADYLYVDSFGGLQFYTAGVEGALYLNRFTIDGTIGFKNGDMIDAEFYNDIRASYYPTDNLMLYIGQSYAFDTNSFNYGTEWAFARKGRAATAVFAQGTAFEGGDQIISVGMRVYLGKRQKSLLRRHREDDPRILTSAPNLVAVSVKDGGQRTLIFGNANANDLTAGKVCFLPICQQF